MWERTSEKAAVNQAVSCPSGETEECFTAYPVQHTDSTGQIVKFQNQQSCWMAHLDSDERTDSEGSLPALASLCAASLYARGLATIAGRRIMSGDNCAAVTCILGKGESRMWAAVLIATKHQHPRSQDADALITDANIRRVA